MFCSSRAMIAPGVVVVFNQKDRHLSRGASACGAEADGSRACRYGGGGQHGGERGPLALPFTENRQLAAVQVHDGLGDRQAQPQPAELAGGAFAALLEGVKEAREQFRLDPYAAVADLDAQLALAVVAVRRLMWP